MRSSQARASTSQLNRSSEHTRRGVVVPNRSKRRGDRVGVKVGADDVPVQKERSRRSGPGPRKPAHDAGPVLHEGRSLFAFKRGQTVNSTLLGRREIFALTVARRRYQLTLQGPRKLDVLVPGNPHAHVRAGTHTHRLLFNPSLPTTRFLKGVQQGSVPLPGRPSMPPSPNIRGN
jgi:hypothetical protein